MKGVQWVQLTDAQAQRIQLHRATHLWMHTAKVQHQAAVDENPHIVVTLEAEDFAAAIEECDVILRGEEVVVRSLEARVHDLVEATAIHRKVALGLKRRHSGCRIIAEREGCGVSHVDARHVSEPLGESRAVGKHEDGAVACWAPAHRQAVWAERSFDESDGRVPVEEVAEEVGVVGVEVAVGGIDGGERLRRGLTRGRVRRRRWQWRGWRRAWRRRW